MRVSAAALLLLGCILVAIVPLYAQVDAHLRLSGARPSQYPGYAPGSAASAYVGLGTAAEAALGDAEHVAEALMNADTVDAAAATRKSLAALQSTAGRKHRKVNKHGRHGHKRSKSSDATIVYDGPSSYGSNKEYPPKEDDYQGLDIPSEDEHQHRWSDSYKPNRPNKGPGPNAPRGYPDADGPEYEGGGGGVRRRYKQGRGPGGYSGGEEPYYDGPGGGKGEGPPGYSDGKYEGPPKKRRGGGYEEEEDGDYSDVYPGPGYSPLTAARSVCKQVLLEEEEVEVVFQPNRDKATVTTLLGTCANPTHPLPTLGGGCVVECQHVEDLCNITPLNSHAFLAPANFKSMDNYYPVMCSYRADAPLKGSCNIVMKVACCSDMPKAEVEDAADKETTKGAADKPASKTRVAAARKSTDKAATDKDATKSKQQAAADHDTTKAKQQDKSAGDKGDKTKTKASDLDDDLFDDEEDDEYYAVVKSKLLRIPLPTVKY